MLPVPINDSSFRDFSPTQHASTLRRLNGTVLPFKPNSCAPGRVRIAEVFPAASGAPRKIHIADDLIDFD